MYDFFSRHKVATSLVTMLIILSIETLMIIPNSYGVITVLIFIAIFFMSSILVILGVAFILISSISLLTSKNDRKQWKRIMLIGWLFLIVTFGNWGILSMLIPFFN